MTEAFRKHGPARWNTAFGAGLRAATPELSPGIAGQRTRQGPWALTNPAAWDERGNGHTAILLEAI